MWVDEMITIFDLYDYVGKTTVPLNYVEGDDWTQLNILHKKVLLIPLETKD